MNSPRMPAGSWAEAQASLKAARTSRWFHVWKWPHWVRHAWVTRKCQWDSNVRNTLSPSVDIIPEYDWAGSNAKILKVSEIHTRFLPATESTPSWGTKYPTVLSAGQLASIARTKV